MLPTTREWVFKAESDYNVALLLLRSRKPGRYDPLCFHCQQCVEKYVKARLNEAGRRFPRTHNLVTLLDLVAPLEPKWAKFADALESLTVYAVVPRYPGLNATAIAAREALKTCRAIRRLARESLNRKS